MPDEPEAMGLLASQSPGPETVRLLGDLIEHQDPKVRSSAAMTLGEQTGAEAEFLLKRASYGDDDAIKDIAARALQERERQQELEKAKQK